MGAGWLLALTSALAFALTGPLAKSIQAAGWSAPSTVAIRCLASGLVLLPFVALRHREQLGLIVRSWRSVVGFGVIAVGGTQLCFFAAIQYVPVGIALLIEYLAPVMLLVLGWARRTAPFQWATLAGAATCSLGLALVVDPGPDSTIDLRGVLWALAAAMCLAFYFVSSSSVAVGLEPVALVASGMLVAGASVLLLAGTGAVAWQVSDRTATLAGSEVPVVAPVVGLVLVCTVSAYVAGVQAARMLGSRLASFAGMLEVVLAAVVSWMLLGEEVTSTQALGAVAILTGVLVIRWCEKPIMISAPDSSHL